MSWITRGAAVAVAAAGGVAARRVLKSRGRGHWPPAPASGGKTTRWHAVTVNRTPDEVAPGGTLPEPLRELGDAVEVDIRPAPGGRGTELYARLRGGEPTGLASVAAKLSDDDPRRAVRRALREAKQLLETGEILQPNRNITTKRTLTSRPLEYATRHGREEGLV